MRQRERKGSVVVLVAVLMVVLLGFGAFAVDVAQMQAYKSELRRTADAAALAAAKELLTDYRDHFGELKRLGVRQLYGLSTQDSAYQKEAAERLRLPFPILSDAKLALARALGLPTFSVAGMTLLKRMALIVDDAIISKVFYPVFPPDKNAEQVIAWLQTSR